MKKLTVVAGVVALSIIVALAVMADQEQPADIQQMEFGAPPEMDQMAFMEGVWDVNLKYRMDPESSWIEQTAVNTNSFILDGCAIQADYEGEMLDMQFKGIGLTCYNRITGKWQTVWTDNMGMGMGVYEGAYINDRLVFTGVDIMPGGVKVLTRITSYDITDTSYQWMMEMSSDSGKTWVESMKATYTKR